MSDADGTISRPANAVRHRAKRGGEEASRGTASGKARIAERPRRKRRVSERLRSTGRRLGDRETAGLGLGCCTPSLTHSSLYPPSFLFAPPSPFLPALAPAFISRSSLFVTLRLIASLYPPSLFLFLAYNHLSFLFLIKKTSVSAAVFLSPNKYTYTF